MPEPGVIAEELVTGLCVAVESFVVLMKLMEKLMSLQKCFIEIGIEKFKQVFKFEFGRINIILGANGTGKSALLNKIKGSPGLFPDRTDVAFVEGGRTLTIPSTLAMDKQTVGFATLEKAERQHKNKRLGNLSDRIKEALFALDRKGEQEFRNHSDAVEAWKIAGSQGECPNRNETPLSELCKIFSGVFPEIELKIDPQSKQITCSKNKSSPYTPTELSDGEKQVFCMITDLLLISHGKPLIVVDEPELNLHPSLAIDLWHLIEGALPDGMFIYATHSVGFALRKDIDSLHVLSKTGDAPICVTNINSIDKDELRAYLGAIPAILTNPKVLVVEGEKTSIDSALYRWLIGDNSIGIEAVGSCNNVVSVLKREGVWETVGTDQSLIGIIDRDFKSDFFINEILGVKNLNVLPFHEIESVLAIPCLVYLVTTRLGLNASPLSEKQIESKIIELWKKLLPHVASRRCFENLSFKISPSLSRKELQLFIQDKKNFADKIKVACKDKIGKVSNAFSDTKVDLVVKDAFQECDKATNSGDIEAILKFIPGKELRTLVLEITKCPDTDALVRAIIKHVKPSEIPVLKELRLSLRNALGLAEQ